MNDTMTTAPPPRPPTLPAVVNTAAAVATPAAPSAAASTPLTPIQTPAQTLEAVTPLLPARLADQFARLLQALPAPSASVVSQVIHHVLASVPSKKRSLPDDHTSASTSPDSSSAPKRPKLTAQTSLAPLPATAILVAIPDLSIASPVRKKLALLLTRDALYLAPSRTDPPVFHLPYAHIAKAVLVDAPEKTKRQPMLLVFGTQAASAAGTAYGALEPVTVAVAVPEAVVGVVPEGMRAGDVGSDFSFAAIFTHLTSHTLAPHTSSPFASAKRSPMGKRTNHPYLSCYHKGKDGHLWLLADGLVYGLKKPFLWIPHANVAAIRLVPNGRNKVDVHVHTAAAAGGAVVKFDMVEADEAAGVGAYVDKVKQGFSKGQPGSGGGEDKAGDSREARAAVPFLAMDLDEDEDDEDGSAPEDEDGESGSEDSDDSGDDHDDNGEGQGEEGGEVVVTSPRVTRSGRAFVGGSSSPSSSKADEDEDEDEEMDELASDADI